MSSVENYYNATVINNINESEGIDIVKIIEIVAGMLCAVIGLLTAYHCTCKGKGRSDNGDIEKCLLKNTEMVLKSTLTHEEDDNKQSLEPTSHHTEEPPAYKNTEKVLESTLSPEEDDSLVPTSHHPEEPPAYKNTEKVLESTLSPEEDDINQSLISTSHHQEEPPAYKTYVVGFLSHCEECKRKIFKHFHKIPDVYEPVIDEKEGKLTITGTDSCETLLQRLLKLGKQAGLSPFRSFGERSEG